MADEDVERLRKHGYDEEAIVCATHVVGIFNYLVRLADAFGIEWEPEVRTSPTHQPELWDEAPKGSSRRLPNSVRKKARLP
jgi:hypothetical protein